MPLEKLVVDNCQTKFVSVLSDLSGLSLRQEVTAAMEEGGGDGEREDKGGEREGGRGRFGTPGMMKDGRFFLTELFTFAKDLMAETDDKVTSLLPLTDDQVCQLLHVDGCNYFDKYMNKM